MSDLLNALDQLPWAAWTANDRGEVDWLSDSARSQLGVATPSADVWARVVHPGDLAQASGSWQQSVASGNAYDVRLRLLCALTGRYRWHASRAHRLVGDGGEVRWVGLNIDIDEALRGLEVQAASMERLHAERERLRSVFANTPVAITLYQGAEHRIAMMNAATRRIVGGRDLEGKALGEAFPEIVSQGLVEIVDRVRDTGVSYEASEFPIEFDRLGDGCMQRAYFSFSMQALRDEDGSCWGVLSSAVEVTEQVVARRALARLAAEREAVLSQLTDGLIMTDLDGRITFVNQRASELHGVARLDVRPEDYSEAYALLREDGSPYPSHDLPLARAVRDGVRVDSERWRIRRPDGEIILVEGDARPVVDGTGQRLGAMLLMRAVPGE